MSEQSIIGARASVMVYDDNQKKWVPSGSSSGLSKVQIYHHQQNNTFRVVGRKLQDHEVVINCSIVKGLKYNQATATFHQWRDSKYVYGLNFSSQQDAEAFSRAMSHALDILNGKFSQSIIPQNLSNNTTYDEDMGYRTMTREDAAIIQQQQNITTGINDVPPTTLSNIQQQSPISQGHHRTSSAPPAPQPPNIVSITQGFSGGNILNSQQQFHHQQQQQQQEQESQLQQQPQPHHQPSTQEQLEPQFMPQPTYASQVRGPNQNAVNQSTNQPIYVSSSSTSNVDQLSHINNGPVYIIPNQTAAAVAATVVAAANSSSIYSTIPQPPPPIPSIYGLTTNVPNGNNIPHSSQSSNSYNAPQGLMSPLAEPPVAPPLPPNFGGLGQPVIKMQTPSIPQMIHNQVVGAGPGRTVPPPPPPPLPMGMLNNKADSQDGNSLAAQLQQAKLKRNLKNVPPPPAENSGSSTSSGGSGNYGTIGRPGMASMMDEMAKTLARRRAHTDKVIEPENNEESEQRLNIKSNTLPNKSTTSSALSSSINSFSNNNNATSSTSESPRLMRKRFESASDDNLKHENDDGLVLTNNHDLESFKAEIIREIQIEIHKAKQEIIEAFKTEFNRR